MLSMHVKRGDLQVQVLNGSGTAVQYVTEAGCNDGYRIVDFLEGAAAPKL